MTREQHLAMADLSGQIAVSRLAAAMSDHPFDNDQDECTDRAILCTVAAAHHGLLAQRCDECGGHGNGLVYDNPHQHAGRCRRCDGAGWIPRADR